MAQRNHFPMWFEGSLSEVLKRIRSGDSAEHCEVLDLGDQRFGDSGVSQLCRVLPKFTALKTLGLGGSKISSSGVSELCKVLSICEHLTVLQLGGNSIDDIGANLIAKILNVTKLVQLYLYDNQIGRDGICALLLSVTNSKTLKVLSIYGNRGVSLALEDIEDILPHCRTLEKLRLGSESLLSNEFCQRIRSVMYKCPESLKVVFGDHKVVCGEMDIGLSFLAGVSDSAVFHREFLSAMHRFGAIRVCRRRVAFVGDSRVGKTWTAKSLRGEPNFHPESEKEFNTQRTAAAESTALQIGDMAFANIEDSGMGEAVPVEETDVEVTVSTLTRPESPPALQRNTISNVALSQHDAGSVREPGRSSDGVYKLHDHVHASAFPEGVLTPEEAKDTVCYLTLWDFGGQKMYHSWYQFFFAPGMIPCVVFDLPSVHGNQKPQENVIRPPRRLSLWKRFLLLFCSKPQRAPVERTVISTVPHIIDYAQQSLHFGGPGCKVLLVGTQVDQVAHSVDERNRVAAEVFTKIRDSSPPSLQNRYYWFPQCGKSRDTVGLCTINNGMSFADGGVNILRASLIRECVRERSGVARSRSSLQGPDPFADYQENRVPRNWYKLEQALHGNNGRDYCSVAELWDFAEEGQFGLESKVEFVSMLASMAAAGVVVLGADIPWAEIQRTEIPDSFSGTVVVLRPQWLIEIGRLVLPRPHDSGMQYEHRLVEYLGSGFDTSIQRLWRAGIVDGRLLRPLLKGQGELDSSMFESMVQLFESRLVLCRIHLCNTDAENSIWFVPSMVVFHAEYFGIEGTPFLNPSGKDIEFTVEFEWLPPGLPLLFVGAMFRGMEKQPRFSVIKGSNRIQFVVGVPEHSPDIFIDLPDGAGGKRVSVWTEAVRPIDDSIRKVMQRIFESVWCACDLLHVHPLLELDNSVDRGLVVSFKVPLIRHQLVADLPSVTLEDVCRRDWDHLPTGCMKEETQTLHRELLRKNERNIPVPSRWLGNAHTSTNDIDNANANAANTAEVPNVHTSGNARSDRSAQQGVRSGGRPQRGRPLMVRRANLLLAS